jgi:hypothetical protein
MPEPKPADPEPGKQASDVSKGEPEGVRPH